MHPAIISAVIQIVAQKLSGPAAGLGAFGSLTYVEYLALSPSDKAAFWVQNPVTDPAVTFMGSPTAPGYILCGGSAGDATIPCDLVNGPFYISQGNGDNSNILIPYDASSDPLAADNQLFDMSPSGDAGGGGGTRSLAWGTNDYWMGYLTRDGIQWAPVEGPNGVYYNNLFDNDYVAFDSALGWITPVPNRNFKLAGFDAMFTSLFMTAVIGLIGYGFSLSITDMLTIPAQISKPIASNLLNMAMGGHGNAMAFVTAQANVALPGSGSVIGILASQLANPSSPTSQTIAAATPATATDAIAAVTSAINPNPYAAAPVQLPATDSGSNLLLIAAAALAVVTLARGKS